MLSTADVEAKGLTILQQMLQEEAKGGRSADPKGVPCVSNVHYEVSIQKCNHGCTISFMFVEAI